RQLAQSSVLFDDTDVAASGNGLLVTLTVDTTGLGVGQSFPLKLSGTQIGEDTNIIVSGQTVVWPQIDNGVITLVSSTSPAPMLAASGGAYSITYGAQPGANGTYVQVFAGSTPTGPVSFLYPAATLT